MFDFVGLYADVKDMVAPVFEYYMVAMAVVGQFAVIAAATPNQVDDRVVGKLQGALQAVRNFYVKNLRPVVDFLGANFFGAKNA